jgi:hypothetical protein
MTTCSLLLVLIAATVVACAVVVSPVVAAPPCPWRTVDQVDNPSIQNLGKWAVEQSGDKLRFDKVESARVQGIGDCTGIRSDYELIIDASPRFGPGDYKYKAVVFVVKALEPEKLISFGLVPFRGD